MNKPTLKTKDETLSDLQTVLYVLLAQFDSIYGSRDHVLALVDRQTDRIVTRFPLQHDIVESTLDISAMPVTEVVIQLHDYAVEGRLDTLLRESWEAVDEDIYGFFRGLEDFPLIYNNAEHFPLGTIIHLLDVARARFVLDFGGWVIGTDGDSAWGHMQLREVALLAGIDEKTARNLAHPQANNRLVTTKWKGRTLVEIEFARQWLAARGFKETVEFDSTLDRDLTRNGFWNLAALGEFVQKHRERLGMDHTDVAVRGKLGDGGEYWLAQLESGSPEFNSQRMRSLAQVLGIEAKPFLLAALKVIQQEQLSRLQDELDTSESSEGASPKSY